MSTNPYSAEELNQRLDRVNCWINNCDQKAGILLAFCGAFVAVLLTSDVIGKGYYYLVEPFYSYWLDEADATFSFKRATLFCGLLPIIYYGWNMVYNLLLALKPKTKIEDFDNNSSPIISNSKLHFQSIAKKSYREFQTESKWQSETEYLDDLCTQIYCNSKICNDKFDNYTKGLNVFTRMLISCLCEIVVYLIFPQI